MLAKVLNLFRRKALLQRFAASALPLLSDPARVSTAPAIANSVIGAAINWFQRNLAFPEFRALNADGAEIDSNLSRILRANPELISAVVRDIILWGNAFLVPVRTASGALTTLEYITALRVSIVPEGYQILTYDGKTITMDSLIHFRFSINPADPRLGISPLYSVAAEIEADTEAAYTLMSALTNGGVGATLITPDTQLLEWLTEEQLNQFRDKMRLYSTGSLAGTPLPMPFKVKVERLSPPLRELSIDKIRDMLAARICAAIGLDPMVLGLPSPNKTYSNYAEAIDAAYESAMLPMLALIARTFTRHKSLVNDDRVDHYDFDLTNVRALSEDATSTAERIAHLWQAGIISLGEAREQLGYRVLPEQDEIFNITFSENVEV